jgi:hypothetical protein
VKQHSVMDFPDDARLVQGSGRAEPERAHLTPVDTISFGPDKDPWRWRPNWRFPGPGPSRRRWLLVGALIAAAAAVTFGFLGRGGQVRHHARVTSAAQLLTGVAAHRTDARLVLGGSDLWWVGWEPRTIDAAVLHHGLSPLLPSGDSAQADQLLAVRGGVVAHISDTATGITYGAPGRVLFIPAAHKPATVIGRATIIALAPGGQRVWLQTAVQHANNGQGAPPNAKSPTWAVNLAGRRVTPILRLPFGLIGATQKGPLTQTLDARRLQLWNGATGRQLPLPVPALADFVAAGQGRLVWSSYTPSARLHITNLGTGVDVAVPLPRHWDTPSQPYPPPPASFDPTGRQLVLPLGRTDDSGDVTAEALFVVNTTTRTMSRIPTQPLLVPDSPAAPSDTLAGAWNQHGVLWVLAADPDYDYYQLGFWTGEGPLHTFKLAPGSPVALSPPGSTPASG